MLQLACPYSMKNNKAFTLTNGGKTLFFLLPPAVLAKGSHEQKERKMTSLLV